MQNRADDAGLPTSPVPNVMKTMFRVPRTAPNFRPGSVRGTGVYEGQTLTVE